MAIFLVRHTAPDIKPGVIYAASNVPVHEAEFKRVMPLIDAALPQEALIVTSHLSRCRRLADFLSMRGTGRIVILDPRLTERDLGRWTGKKWEQIPRREAKEFDGNFLDHWPPPMETENGPVLRGLNVYPRLGAGESVRAMQARVIEGFEAAWDIAEGRNLVIISHAGPIAAMIAYWQGEILRRGIEPSPACGDVVQLAYVDGQRHAFVARRATAIEEINSF